MCALQFAKYVFGKIQTYIKRMSKSSLRKLPVKKFKSGLYFDSFVLLYVVVFDLFIRFGDGAGNTVKENSSVFSLIRMR